MSEKEEFDILVELGMLQREVKKVDRHIYNNYKKKIYKLEKRINKAIEHLHKRNEQNKSALTNKEETIISKHELLKLEIINNEILENILRGDDNE